MDGKKQRMVINLKLRLSIGTAGNNRIKSGAINSTFSLAETSDKNIYFNETSAVVLQHASNLSNPDLKWETTLTRNLGIDFGFWNNRLSGSIDAYWNTTKDLLMNATIPSSTGFSTQYKNFGQTSNKGIELALDAVIVDTKDFGLNANFNISYNRAKIDKLAGGQTWQSSNWEANLPDKTTSSLKKEDVWEKYMDMNWMASILLTIFHGTAASGYLTRISLIRQN